jgi:hypothetical protein
MIYETNCLILTAEHRDKIIDVLGDRYWNDTENIYCAPISRLTDAELEKLGVTNRRAQYLVAEMA